MDDPNSTATEGNIDWNGIFSLAQEALSRRDIVGARSFAAELVRHFPDRPHGYQAFAEIDIELRDYHAAEVILAEGLERCAAKHPLLITRAFSASKQQKYDEAIRCWRDLLAVKPDHPRGVMGLVEAFSALGDHVKAEEALSDARRVLPDSKSIAIAWARSASNRGDWGTALYRWSVLREEQPDNPEVRHHLGIARERWGLEAALNSQSGGEPQNSPHVRADIAITENPEIRELLLGFESMGSNCEFGLVQRHFEAEPLGLLRWASVSYDSLMHLLVSRFASLADPETIRLSADTGQEWYLRDQISGVSFHTFVRANPSESEIFFSKQIKRLSWLREQTLQKLQSCEKLFVYSVGYQQISIEQMKKLHQAMRAYGSTTLVCVSPIESGETAGEIHCLEEGLFRGTVERDGRVGSHWDIAFDDWVSICKQVMSRSA